MRPTGDGQTSATWLVSVILISLTLFVVTLALLPVMVVWGAGTQRVSKMEAWWWLSAPFAIGFQFSLFINFANVQGAASGLVPLNLLYFIGAVSSGVWALVTAYQMKTRQLIQSEKVMLILAVIAFIPWMNLHRGP
jgi:hypothetical protein